MAAATPHASGADTLYGDMFVHITEYGSRCEFDRAQMIGGAGCC